MQSSTTTGPIDASDDLLFRHVRDLPYFRGLLRAVESSFYQELSFEAPVYDLGCGDGHFASVTFDQRIDAGLDPWRGPVREAKRRGTYAGVVQAEAARSPFPDAHFHSGFSNSVLEHIPRVQNVLDETGRVLREGALFVFCVPNENFTRDLSVARWLDRIGLKGLARAYRRFFNAISRHAHCDAPGIWRTRLQVAGFEIERHWDYFPPSALAVLEWGHFFGLPAALCKALFGHWILSRSRWSLGLTLALIRRHYDESISSNLKSGAREILPPRVGFRWICW